MTLKNTSSETKRYSIYCDPELMEEFKRLFRQKKKKRGREKQDMLWGDAITSLFTATLQVAIDKLNKQKG